MPKPATASAADRYLVALPPQSLAAGDAGAPLRWAVAKPGSWRALYGPITLTEKRLRDLAAAYDPTKYDRAAINFDHAWGGPAEGWVERLEFADGHLWVFPVDLSAAVTEGIASGRWARVSMELDLEHPITGDWYFSGLAVLGVAQPAVKGLPPLQLADGRALLTLTDLEDPPVPTPQKPPTTPTPDPAETPPVNPPVEGLPADAQAALAAARSEAEATLAETRRLAEETRRINDQARASHAEARVGQFLAAQTTRIPPAALRAGLREVLLAAATAQTPLLVRLATPATATTPAGTREVSLYDALTGVFEALPDQSALFARDLAGPGAGEALAQDDRPPADRAAHLAAGIKDERYLELRRKYQLN